MTSLQKKLVIKIGQEELVKMLALLLPADLQAHVKDKTIDDVESFTVDGASQKLVITLKEEDEKSSAQSEASEAGGEPEMSLFQKFMSLFSSPKGEENVGSSSTTNPQ